MDARLAALFETKSCAARYDQLFLSSRKPRLSFGIELRPNLPMVQEFLNNSPAQKSGLGYFDLILSIDGQPIYTACELATALLLQREVKPMLVKYRRGWIFREVAVTPIFVERD